jgi:hypothetical protein
LRLLPIAHDTLAISPELVNTDACKLKTTPAFERVATQPTCAAMSLSVSFLSSISPICMPASCRFLPPAARQSIDQTEEYGALCLHQIPFAVSEISPLTIKAYPQTGYRVFCGFPFALKVGVASESLAKLYERLNTHCGVFVTAFNPFSNDVSEAANAVRQLELEKDLRRHSLTFFQGVEKHPSGMWAAEPSYLSWDWRLRQPRPWATNPIRTRGRMVWTRCHAGINAS